MASRSNTTRPSPQPDNSSNVIGQTGQPTSPRSPGAILRKALKPEPSTPAGQTTHPNATGSQLALRVAERRTSGTPLLSSLFERVAGLADKANAARRHQRELKEVAEEARTLLELVSSQHNLFRANASQEMVMGLEQLSKAFAEVEELAHQACAPDSYLSKIRSEDHAAQVLIRVREEMARALRKFDLQHKVELQIILDRLVGRLNNGLTAVPTQSTEPQYIATFSLPSKPQVFFGRDDLVTQMVTAITEEPPARFALLGMGGIGKSTVALMVFYHPKVEQLFNNSRFFVSCEAATTCTGLIGAIATALKLTKTGPYLFENVLHALSQHQPALLGLDNLDDCYQKDKGAVEECFTKLCELSHLRLIVTLRGTACPYGHYWTNPPIPPLQPLDLVFAQHIYNAIVSKDTKDPSLDSLLHKLSCIPLAVKLVAIVAQEDGLTPSNILDEWNASSDPLSLFDRAHNDRLMSLNFSIGLSIHSQLMKSCPAALELLQIVCHLPDGVLTGKLKYIVPSNLSANRAATILCRSSLAQKDPGHDLHVHALVREYIQAKHAPEPRLLHCLESFYLSKTCILQWPNNKQMTELCTSMTLEINNIQAVLEHILKQLLKIRTHGTSKVWWTASHRPSRLQLLSLRLFHNRNLISLSTAFDLPLNQAQMKLNKLLSALHALATLQKWSRQGTLSTMELLVKVSLQISDTKMQADCQGLLGSLHSWWGNYEAAEIHGKAVVQIYRDLGNKTGIAESLRSLGENSLMQGHYEEAQKQLTEALRRCQELGNKMGIAKCLWSLGEISRMQGHYEEAQKQLTEALRRRQELGSKSGIAECLWSLGEISRLQGHYEEAQKQLTEALRIRQELGNKTGIAKCLRSLGNISRKQGHYEEAQNQLTEALRIDQELGNKTGIAECLWSLGDISWMQDHYEDAQKQLTEALRIRQELGNKTWIAKCLWNLGEISRTQGHYEEAQKQVTEALRICQELGNKMEIAECLWSLGEILQMQGHYEEAQKQLTEALMTFQQLGKIDWINVCMDSLTRVASEPEHQGSVGVIN